jgi:hypothetical protein
MIGDYPDRVSVYHTANTGDPPAMIVTGAQGLRAKISAMSNAQVLEANAEGLHQYRATHLMRVEYSEDLVPMCAVKCLGDDRNWLVISVRESNLRRLRVPDHYLCELSELPAEAM